MSLEAFRSVRRRRSLRGVAASDLDDRLFARDVWAEFFASTVGRGRPAACRLARLGLVSLSAPRFLPLALQFAWLALFFAVRVPGLAILVVRNVQSASRVLPPVSHGRDG